VVVVDWWWWLLLFIRLFGAQVTQFPRAVNIKREMKHGMMASFIYLFILFFPFLSFFFLF